MLRYLLTVLWVSLLAGAVHGADAPVAAPTRAGAKRVQVTVIPIRNEISDPVLYVLRRGLKEAEEKRFDVVVLDMNTPGGSGQTAFDMMEAIGRFSGRSITYVNKEAMSAGAFIAASTDEIWFRPKSVIGAAAAVTSQGQDIPETMRLKINSFLRAKIRAVSEGKGYRGQVVSAMIDKDLELKIDDKVLKKPGELLSLTAEEAMEKYGNPPQPLLGAGIASDLDALLVAKYGVGNYTITKLEVTWSERLAQLLTGISPILLGLGMLALFIEFKTPGFGFFGVAGIVLLAVVFLSSYVAGLSGHEPILVFAVGLVLLILEVLFFPGVVVVALTGIVLMLGSLVWAMADLWPNEPITWSGGAFVKPLMNVGLGLAIAAVLAALVLRFLPKSWFWDRMVLTSSVGSSAQLAGVAPEVSAKTDTLIGQEGVAITPLRPFGQVEIAGTRYEARLNFGTAASGTRVVVTGRSDFGLTVEVAA
ncbi:hypothetical protein DB347_01075 [Opitutaceae bacterium EW11]|nr:hypothetical protein DB347_01075 [Opitutaceae bacterium EW11]